MFWIHVAQDSTIMTISSNNATHQNSNLLQKSHNPLFLLFCRGFNIFHFIINHISWKKLDEKLEINHMQTITTPKEIRCAFSSFWMLTKLAKCQNTIYLKRFKFPFSLSHSQTHTCLRLIYDITLSRVCFITPRVCNSVSRLYAFS